MSSMDLVEEEISILVLNLNLLFEWEDSIMVGMVEQKDGKNPVNYFILNDSPLLNTKF